MQPSDSAVRDYSGRSFSAQFRETPEPGVVVGQNFVQRGVDHTSCLCLAIIRPRHRTDGAHHELLTARKRVLNKCNDGWPPVSACAGATGQLLLSR